MRLSYFVLALLSAFPAQAQQVNVAGRLSDLNFVATEVPRLDPYFFAHLDPAQFQLAVENLNARVSTASEAEFNVGLAQLMAMAADAHTQLYLGNGAVFPLRFRWLDDGVFVAATAAEYSQALGARVTAIGGLPIDQVIERLATTISYENVWGLHSTAEQYLRVRLVLEGLNIVPAAPTSDFTFRTLGGDDLTLQVAAEVGPAMPSVAPDWSRGTVPAYLQSQNLFYWFTYSPASRLLYFKYNMCNDMAGSSFSSLATRLLGTMDTNPIDTLVFDFRGNPGGNNMIWQPLLTGFQQRLPGLLSNPNFRAYVAFDKASFSAAVDNAMKLKSPSLLPGVDLGKVIQTIGEPAGQAPAMYGNTVQFTLPSSRQTGYYPTTYFPRPSWIPEGQELVPDIAVGVRSTDYFARFDPVMAAILARSVGAPAAPSGDVIAVNAASFRTEQGLTPGAFAAAFGRFSTAPDEVLASGVAGQIVYTSPSQVNFLVPDSVLPGPVAVSLRAAGKELATGQASVTATGPGIFVMRNADPSQPGAVVNDDYSLNGNSTPAARGSVVQIFATGCGSDPGTVRAYFGESPAQVMHSEYVSPGLYLIDARIPDGVSGQVAVFIIAGNIASNGATAWVQ